MAPKKKPAKPKVVSNVLKDDQYWSQLSKRPPVLQATKEAKKDAAPAAGDVEAASIEELHQKIQTLEKENNKEEEYRNYMQLERVSRMIPVEHAARVNALVWVANGLPNSGSIAVAVLYQGCGRRPEAGNLILQAHANV